jgi:hypothetical protein
MPIASKTDCSKKRALSSTINPSTTFATHHGTHQNQSYAHLEIYQCKKQHRRGWLNAISYVDATTHLGKAIM